MKLYQLFVQEHFSAVVLYVLITLASIDYTSVVDYALKATVGSAIWFGFRLLGDYYSVKIKREFHKDDSDHDEPLQP